MNQAVDLLAKSVLQKDVLRQCSVHELQQLVDQYPYFSAAQLLLAKKLSIEPAENYELYKQQLEKTFLFFNNPLRLQYMLQDTGDAEITPAESLDTAPTNFETENNTDKKVQEEIQTETPEMITEPVALSEEKKSEPIIEQPEEEPGSDFTSIKEEPGVPVELPSLKEESTGADQTELIFEPYHTVDYFASQGIKFKEEEKPKDRFGQQLKSFTEWLKTLKRLPDSETEQPIDINAEQKVEQLAGQSLQDREVITETMAEVWEKQGNAAKAIDIYNKLSLLDPSKRAYFAAKIEELKKTT